jgi:LmbE family N-acetylglucosaminyl deacetylase
MLNIKISSNILVVVAHPDDEFWGLGGTLLRLKELGNNISIFMISNGERGDGSGEERLSGSANLFKEIGMKFETMMYTANKLFIYQTDIIRRLDYQIERIQPDIIFTHYDKDLHQDHTTVFNCVHSAIRNKKDTSLFQIETPFNDNFTPNFFVDITSFMERKKELYKKYFKNEMDRRKEYQINYLENVNRYRGLQSNNDYAESFILKKGFV